MTGSSTGTFPVFSRGAFVVAFFHGSLPAVAAEIVGWIWHGVGRGWRQVKWRGGGWLGWSDGEGSDECWYGL